MLLVPDGGYPCDESHPACLDFHHRDPREKVMILSKVTNQRGWSIERILAEIAKCEVICANCHRKEHWSEQDADDDIDEIRARHSCSPRIDLGTSASGRRPS